MHKSLYKNRKKLQEKLLKAIEDFDYRHVRYEVNYSIALLFTPEPMDLTPLLHKYIRETDLSLVMEDRLYAVAFDSADELKGIKAANKLLTFFQQLYFSHSIYAAVTTAGDYSSTYSMITNLFDLLDYSISHQMDNHVIDASQMMKSR